MKAARYKPIALSPTFSSSISGVEAETTVAQRDPRGNARLIWDSVKGRRAADSKKRV
jgi:hypothetical protein